MQNIVKFFGNLLDLYYRFAATICAIIIAFVTLMITGEILNRLIFNQSFQFVMQFSGYSLFVVTFLGAGWVLRQDSHISIDFLVERFSERPRLIIKIIMYILGCGLSIFLLYLGWKYTGEAWVQGKSTDYPTLFPLAYLLVLIPIGWFFMAVEFIIQIVGLFKKLKDTNGTAEVNKQSKEIPVQS
ncbi:MAG TPA: TRAP transporter small permease [Firmicutes bacterium]|nr:TRAP transporter small permease [Bacillota bacterium]